MLLKKNKTKKTEEKRYGQLSKTDIVREKNDNNLVIMPCKGKCLAKVEL